MIHIFTDGSSRGNPGPGGWGVIIHQGNLIEELGGSAHHTTNNRMEMTAVIEALRFIGNTDEDITLYTDSKYTIDGITKWVQGWKNNGWQTKNKTEVLNRDLWELLVQETRNKNITWNHVAGHIGIPGNERVDSIANAFAEKQPLLLYSGLEKDYSIPISKLSGVITKKQKNNDGKAYSYLAFVDGSLHRFLTWKECETFVKGKSAKFRKAISSEDEASILKEWGILDV